MTDERPLAVKLDPDVADSVLWSEDLTPYDEEHLVTYLRLLDAESEEADWREVARIVLHRDPEKEPERTQSCWQSHLNRARWMTAHGYRRLLDQAGGWSRRPGANSH
ncbi:MAG: DUF2285 domain-containing protein [Alphaproteobacteria bacterium]|nr:DUF2285 domain-containing protein [Alphaproteobacteria bacterium]MDE2494693.1 DUF2285 domain-containing protein [Alphaproteobacteria bacterium]